MKLKKIMLSSLVCFSSLFIFHSGSQVWAEETKESEAPKEIQGRAISPFIILKPQAYEIGFDSKVQGTIRDAQDPKEFADLKTVQLYINDELVREATVTTQKRFEVPTKDLTIKETDKVEVQAIDINGEKIRNRVPVVLKPVSFEWDLDPYTLFDNVITGTVTAPVTAVSVVEEYIVNGEVVRQELIGKTPVVNGKISLPINIFTIYDENANVKVIPYKGVREGAVGEKLPILNFDLKADIKPFVLNKDKNVTGTFTGKGLAKVQYARLDVDGYVDYDTEVLIDETGNFSILGEESIYSGAEVNVVTYDGEDNELVSFPVEITEQKRIKDYFPDPNLAQAVAEYLGGGRTVESFVTEEELAVKNYALQANDRGIKDVTGIEYLQPKIIFLYSNEIEDLTPFTRMKTNRYTDNLQLQYNKIKDISPLVELGKYSPTVMCHLILTANELDNTAMKVLKENSWEFRHVLHLALAANHIDDFSNIRNTAFWGSIEWTKNDSFWNPLYQTVTLPAQSIVNGRLEVTMPGLDIDNKIFVALADEATTSGFIQNGNKVVWENLPEGTEEVLLNAASIDSKNSQTGKVFANQVSVFYKIPIKK